MLVRFLPVALAAACLAGPALAQGKNRPPAEDPSMRSQRAEPKKFPIDMQWTLVSLSGKTPPGDRPTLMVDGQFRVHGFGGCNAFSATSIPQPGQRFAVGPIAQTKRACDKAVSDFERAFLIAYRTAVVWDIRDGYLMFGSQAGELKFERGL
jgi:heat shock protein HslJ